MWGPKRTRPGARGLFELIIIKPTNFLPLVPFVSLLLWGSIPCVNEHTKK